MRCKASFLRLQFGGVKSQLLRGPTSTFIFCYAAVAAAVAMQTLSLPQWLRRAVSQAAGETLSRLLASAALIHDEIHHLCIIATIYNTAVVVAVAVVVVVAVLATGDWLLIISEFRGSRLHF